MTLKQKRKIIEVSNCSGCPYIKQDEYYHPYTCQRFDLTINDISTIHPECKLKDNPLDIIRSAIKLCEEWCEDQSIGLTDGQICMSALKDIRRHIK